MHWYVLAIVISWVGAQTTQPPTCEIKCTRTKGSVYTIGDCTETCSGVAKSVPLTLWDGRGIATSKTLKLASISADTANKLIVETFLQNMPDSAKPFLAGYQVEQVTYGRLLHHPQILGSPQAPDVYLSEGINPFFRSAYRQTNKLNNEMLIAANSHLSPYRQSNGDLLMWRNISHLWKKLDIENQAALPFFLEACKIDNTYICIPNAASFHVFFYAKSIFEQLGLQIPKTWTDFISILKAIKQKTTGVVPLVWFGETFERLFGSNYAIFFEQLLLRMYPIDFVQQVGEGKVPWNDERILEAMHMLDEIIQLNVTGDTPINPALGAFSILTGPLYSIPRGEAAIGLVASVEEPMTYIVQAMTKTNQSNIGYFFFPQVLPENERPKNAERVVSFASLFPSGAPASNYDAVDALMEYIASPAVLAAKTQTYSSKQGSSIPLTKAAADAANLSPMVKDGYEQLKKSNIIDGFATDAIFEAQYQVLFLDYSRKRMNLDSFLDKMESKRQELFLGTAAAPIVGFSSETQYKEKFDATDKVYLTAGSLTEGCVIYYTTDGSLPSEASPTLTTSTEQIQVTYATQSTVIVNARAFHHVLRPSATTTFSVTFEPEVVKESNSSRTLVIVLSVVLSVLAIVVIVLLLFFFCLGRIREARNRRLQFSLAPHGVVTLVFTDVQNSTALWAGFQEEMKSSIAMMFDLKKRLIKQHGGYECKTQGDAIMAAFDNPDNAIKWAEAVQLQLMKIEWPKRLLTHEAAKPVEEDGVFVFNGLRVRMGIHMGEMDAEYDSTMHRIDYFGPEVNFAARVASLPCGGQVVCSNAIANLYPDRVVCLGDHNLKGIDGFHPIYQVNYKQLEDRNARFPPLNAKNAEISAFDKPQCGRCLRPCRNCTKKPIRNNRLMSTRSSRTSSFSTVTTDHV